MQSQASRTRLMAAVTELESHVGQAGWGQPTRLFAIAESDDIFASQPDLAADLSLQPGTLTCVEQEGFDPEQPVDELLAKIAWPESVVGAAIALERIVLPPSAEMDLPDDETRVTSAAAQHPKRNDVRMVAAVLRDGTTDTVLRLQQQSDHLIRGGSGQELLPQVVEALRATFA